MKKIILSLVIVVISFTMIGCNSIKHKYISLNSENKIEFINANNDSLAYWECFKHNEISRCVETAMNDAKREIGSFLYDPNLKYKDYNFVLWKISYNNKLEKDLKNKEISLNKILNMSGYVAQKYVDKYDLKLERITYDINEFEVEKLLNRLYDKNSNSGYWHIYNSMINSYNKSN